MSAPAPHVRPAAAADLPRLVALMAALDHPVDEATLRERMAQIGAHPDYATFVAEAEGAGTVGMAGVMRVLSWERGWQARIIALVVDPAWRGRGIGATLVRACEGWGRESGAAAIHLTTAHRRTGAHRFYERVGYADTGKRYVKALG